MDIGEVSKKSGIPVSALRYYEELGLIKSSDRKGLRRQYNAQILEALALITLAKQAGFQLNELPKLFHQQKTTVSIDRSQLKKKSLQIDQQIKRLQAAREGLMHASTCKAPSHLECAKFQRLLSLATRKQTLHNRRRLAK